MNHKYLTDFCNYIEFPKEITECFLDYLKAGNKMGAGVGMIFYKKKK